MFDSSCSHLDHPFPLMKKTAKSANDVLVFVISFKNENGYSPSIREISEGLNSMPLAAVHRFVKELEGIGKLKRISGVARGLIVI